MPVDWKRSSEVLLPPVLAEKAIRVSSRRSTIGVMQATKDRQSAHRVVSDYSVQETQSLLLAGCALVNASSALLS